MRAVLYIPVPPSANNLFFNMPRKGRVKTAAYKLWLEQTARGIRAQRPPIITGDARIDITIERPNKASDLDNRLKAVLDALQKAGVIANDKQIVELAARWGDVEGCRIDIADVAKVAA